VQVDRPEAIQVPPSHGAPLEMVLPCGVRMGVRDARWLPEVARFVRRWRPAMLNFTGSLKVYLATVATDLRKSFNGLHAATTQVLQEDPGRGLVRFFATGAGTGSRRCTGTGQVCGDDQAAGEGTFSWPQGVDVDNGKLRLSPEALGLLLEGVDLREATCAVVSTRMISTIFRSLVLPVLAVSCRVRGMQRESMDSRSRWPI